MNQVTFDKTKRSILARLAAEGADPQDKKQSVKSLRNCVRAGFLTEFYFRNIYKGDDKELVESYTAWVNDRKLNRSGWVTLNASSERDYLDQVHSSPELNITGKIMLTEDWQRKQGVKI